MKKNCLENQEEGGVRTPEPEGTRPKRVAFDHFATSPNKEKTVLFVRLSTRRQARTTPFQAFFGDRTQGLQRVKLALCQLS